MRWVVAVLLAAIAAISGARAASWTVDYAHSSLGFIGKQAGTPFDGRFTRWKAEIDFDPARPETGHALVTIDLASATTGDKTRDVALPQADWFDVRDFPQATFEAVGFRPAGGQGYEAVGRLTIRGIRKDVVLPFTLETQGSSAHAVGKLEILRTDFGVGQGEWGTGAVVGLDVTVAVDLRATR